MIIATSKPFIIGQKVTGNVASLEKEWIYSTFIVERKATQEEMFQQLKDLNYSIEQYIADCIGDELYYKILVD